MIKPLPNPPWRWLDFLAIAVCGTYLIFWCWMISVDHLPGRELYWMFVPLLIGVVALICFRVAAYSTNGRIRGFLVLRSRYKVYDDSHPTYRLVDFLRAAERFAERSEIAYAVSPSNINVDLATYINQLSMQPPPPQRQEKMCVGYEQSGYFPSEVIWLIQGAAGRPVHEKLVLRVRRIHVGTFVELACADADAATVMLKRIADDALAHSIFRGQFIEIRYAGNPHRDYDYQFESAEMTVTFKPKPNITSSDIILDPKIEAILRRNLFDFFTHRNELHALGLPRKRALLFYGPPGTGKTHTCRYIHTLLKGITSILATGESLTRLQDLGKLARQLQPTLVILEDVDLVFHAREINPYGMALGDLMDQLDGFTPDEEVIFMLTTNAIERVEAAIRDRPGRINQCLYFGMPTDDLRRRYLVQYLRTYGTATVDFDHIVKQTDGTSQAFMKEYVLRTVQVAAEANGYPTSGIELKTEHFDTAFEELISHGDSAGHSIMGFRTGPRGFGVND